MKHILTFLFISLSIFLHAQDFTITNYTIDLEINADGSFDIKETIDVNFSAKKRGIYRDIDNSYTVNGGKFYLDIYDIEIPNHKYKVDKNKNKVSIRIGQRRSLYYGKSTIHNSLQNKKWNNIPSGASGILL